MGDRADQAGDDEAGDDREGGAASPRSLGWRAGFGSRTAGVGASVRVDDASCADASCADAACDDGAGRGGVGPAEGARGTPVSRRHFLALGTALGTAAGLAVAVGRPRPAAGVRFSSARTDTVDAPPPEEFRARAILPPGESGFFGFSAQLAYEHTQRPSTFGPYVDDERTAYWQFGYEPGGFARVRRPPERPRPDVRIYRDDLGVPVVYGDSGEAVWFGVGWAAGQDRLFEMDLLRRSEEGRLAELLGPSAIPGDVKARIRGYTAEEYDVMLAALPAETQSAITALAAGINAWLDRVAADPVELLPAEYGLSSATPEPWTARDVMATAVEIVRSVAAAGGNEMDNVANLVTLEGAFPTAAARGIFQDLFWLLDEKAVTTVPASSGRFPNSPLDAAGRERVFQAMADYAETLPASLATGPGTGAFPVPSESPTTSGGLGEDREDGPDGDPGPTGSRRRARQVALRRAVSAITAWTASLHGGSYELAVAGSRSATGKPLLISGPQLGYGYPSELYLLEVHGGGYDARGATVPGIPVVGIGYTPRVAWGLTTGESKTIDSFVETLRPHPAGGPPQYLFDGAWRDTSCHQEVVLFRRLDADGLPAGPPSGEVTIDVCRTHHGPIVATTPGAGRTTEGLGRSLGYAIWRRELETLTGILRWNRARSLADFAAGVALVTWNENAMAADADGHIGYWHPGLYPRRSPRVDLRFPTPGTGGYEWEGFLPFDQMPHAVDPEEGYLANWNTKPSVLWLEEATIDPGQPAGFAQRVEDITSQVVGRHDLTLDDLAAIDRYLGITDHRARSFVPLLLSLRGEPALSPLATTALEQLATWDFAAYDPPAGVPLGVETATTDGPAPTIFSAFVTSLRQLLFGFLPAPVVAADDSPSMHLFDIKPIDNLALRVLDPATSALRPSRDYLDGQTPTSVLAQALEAAVVALVATYGTDDVASWRRPHPTSSVCSLTGGAIGPCLTMPFEDRGSYIHHVAFL